MTGFLTSNTRCLIVGASGGIGSALTMALGNRCGMGNVQTGSRSADGFDISDEGSIIKWVQGLDGPFDVILIATGALEIHGMGPEKGLSQLTSEAMRAQFETNALGPALLIKHLNRLLEKNAPAVLGVLSARVGSIEDNRLGGWYSYRAAKAALNQFIRSSAIEIARTRPQSCVVALHPGTVRTELTAKYAKGHPTVSPQEAAGNLLDVIDHLKPAQTGTFLDYSATKIAW